MELNQAGIDMIKKYEDCRLTAYTATDEEAAEGKWTIGYGMTFYPDGTKVQEGDTITADEAESLFAELLKIHYADPAARLIKNKDTTDNQFSAIVCLVYNIGITNFKGSTVLREHNAGDYAGAADAFLMWDKQKGKVLKGLVARRKAEKALYLS